MTDNNNYFITHIGTYHSERLCETIITFRVLGLFKEDALACMYELIHRRNLGDDFDYETFIETKIKEIPEISFKLNNAGFVR